MCPRLRHTYDKLTATTTHCAEMATPDPDNPEFRGSLGTVAAGTGVSEPVSVLVSGEFGVITCSSSL